MSFALGEHRGASGPPPRVRPPLQASRTLQSREGCGRARSRSPARTRNAGTTPSSSGLRPKMAARPPLGGRGSSTGTPSQPAPLTVFRSAQTATQAVTRKGTAKQKRANLTTVSSSPTSLQGGRAS